MLMNQTTHLYSDNLIGHAPRLSENISHITRRPPNVAGHTANRLGQRSIADGQLQPTVRIRPNQRHPHPVARSERQPTTNRSHTYARANDKFNWWVDAVNRQPQPDFIVAIGDLIHGGRLDRLPVDFDLLKQLLKPLQPPLYPTLGNHEVVQNEGNPEYERPYRKMFGDDRVSYTFEHGGILFIMLNNAGAATVKDKVIHARNAWLRDVLEKNPKKEKILCCHIPIVAVRDEKTLAESFGFVSFHAHDPELLDLVDSHANSILAVLSGHLHLTGYVERKGVHHIDIAGTASYPTDYARFAVYDNKIEMNVHQLPKELS